MTIKAFWDDPYRLRQEARVSSALGDEVRLDETIFFAFSGGQESDAGSIGGHPVQEARRDGLDIAYRLPQGHGLRVGDVVMVEVDGLRRYGLMRHHFAAEMILQLVYALEPGIDKVGAHIGPAKARIDFAREGSISALFDALQAQSAALVAADLPIITAFSDEANHRRFWQVEGFAQMGCGGTHPRRTGEIGTLSLKRKNQGKGVERIEITLEARPFPASCGTLPG
ncbi:TPA: alanyl-tRNA editing protein [Stenotrophomonas maltophilia]|nr:alanyl-tRNA editing protein [Stenotrophomonas maltophilia]HDS1534729.1 alanyl-tRNA editing protein [Stenotrophomonas maltophilia]